jgi:hypothetical protein
VDKKYFDKYWLTSELVSAGGQMGGKNCFMGLGCSVQSKNKKKFRKCKTGLNSTKPKNTEKLSEFCTDF